jgi:CheY-like chemotaxis protein
MDHVLFLDDSIERTKQFRSLNPSATCVETAAEAIDLLSKSVWDGVFLDHDLGGEAYVDSELPNTGMEVVRWIVANKPFISWIVIHTLNSDAGNRMEGALRDAGYTVIRRPFAWTRSYTGVLHF